MADHKQMIADILAADVVPKWRLVYIAKEVGVSVSTAHRLAHGTQEDTMGATAERLAALHAKVMKAAKK